MKRSHWHLAAGAMCALLAGCATDRPSPTAPDIPTDSSADARQLLPMPGECVPLTIPQISRIFDRRTSATVVLDIVLIQLEMRAGRTANARTMMFRLWDNSLRLYYDGRLTDGTSPTTRQRLIEFGTGLYCLVGLDGSGLAAVLNPLGEPSAVQVLFPSPEDQTVISGDGMAGVQIPGNTLTTPVTIQVTRIAESFAPFAGPLNTPLDQYGPYFHIGVVPAQEFAQEVLVGVCVDLPETGDLPPRVHLAHNVGSGIDILPREIPAFLNCGVGTSSSRSLRQLFNSGDYARAALRAVQMGASLLTPQPLHALSLGIGGRTRTFSPFGGVDTHVELVAASATTQSGSAGAPVSQPPSVLMRTIGGQTPLGGGAVTFRVTGGDGTLTAPGGNTQLTSLTLATGATGTATVGSWTLTAGSNSVTASGAYELTDDVQVDGTIVFAADAPVPEPFTVLPYGSGGWKFRAGPIGHTPGFESVSFDDSRWSTGSAAFGGQKPSAAICPLDVNMRTYWYSIPSPTELLVRHQFLLPAGFTGTLKVALAVSNDARVYVNGTQVGSLLTHDGCAVEDGSVVSVPATLLRSGPNNVIAVRALNRGTTPYLDVKVTAVP